jgi:PqqD family protein of HPr-rel-A system
LIDPDSITESGNDRPPSESSRWRVPDGQHFAFADFDDGIVVFDARVGATHLVNATAAEALALVDQTPGIATDDIYRKLLECLNLDEGLLPRDAIVEMMWQLENLGLVMIVA